MQKVESSSLFIRFTEGPGAGIGHVFRSTDHGVTWTSMLRVVARYIVAALT